MVSPIYRSFAVTLVATLLVTGCAAPLQLVEGTYTNAQGGGTLTVSGEGVEVRIPTRGARTPFEQGTYGYTLYPDGLVQLFGSSNSSYYLLVVMEYEWRWTGSAFEARDRQDGTIVTFTPVR